MWYERAFFIVRGEPWCNDKPGPLIVAVLLSIDVVSVSDKGMAPDERGGMFLSPISARSLSIEIVISLHTRVINSSSRSCVRLATISETGITSDGVKDCSRLLYRGSRFSFRKPTILFLILCIDSSCNRVIYALVNTGSRISCFNDIVTGAEDKQKLVPDGLLTSGFTR